MCNHILKVFILYLCSFYVSATFSPLVQQDQATWQQLLITLSRIWMSAIWLSIKNEVFKSVWLVCWVFFLGGGLEWRGRGIWRGMSTRIFSIALRYPRFLLEWPFMKHSFGYHEVKHVPLSYLQFSHIHTIFLPLPLFLSSFPTASFCISLISKWSWPKVRDGQSSNVQIIVIFFDFQGDKRMSMSSYKY